MGGGGHSGKISLPAYIQDIHQLWTVGTLVDISGAEDLEQSATTWSLKHGINNAMSGAAPSTGNPYASLPGTAVFADPVATGANDLDFLEVETKLDTFYTKVLALDEAVDWPTLFAAAQTEAAKLTPMVTVEAMRASALSGGEVLREQVENRLGTNADEIADYVAFIDQAEAKADEAGMLTTVDSDVISADAKSEAMALFSFLRGAANPNPISDEGWARLITEVITKADVAGVLVGVDVGAAVTAAVAAASTEIDAAITKKDESGIVEATDWAAFADAVVTKLDTVGVLKDLDVAAVSTAAKTEASAEITEAFTKLAAITEDPSADWQGFVTDAVAKIDTVGVLKDIVVGTITPPTAAATAIAAPGVITPGTINSTTVATNARGGADTELTGAKANVSTGVVETTDWGAFVDAAVAKADTLNVLKVVDVSAIVTAARSGSDAEIGAAIAEAISSVDDSVILAAIDAFELQADYVKNRALNRFTAAVADVNAVQSSAFLFGFALIEAEHLRGVNEFSSKMRRELYSEAFRAHTEVYRAQLQAELQADLMEKQARDQLVREGVSSMLDVLRVRTEYEKVWLQLHIRAYEVQMQAENAAREVELRAALEADVEEERLLLQRNVETARLGTEVSVTNARMALEAGVEEFRGSLQAEVVEKQSRDRMLEQGLLHLLRMLEAKMSYKQTILQLHRLAYGDRLSAGMQGEVLEKQSRDELLGQGLSQLGQLLSERVRYEQTMLGLHVQAASDALRAHFGGVFEDKQARDRFVQSGMGQAVAMLQGRRQSEAQFVSAFEGVYSGQLDNLFRAEMHAKERREEFILSGAQSLAGLHQVRRQLEVALSQAQLEAFLGHLRVGLQREVQQKGAEDALVDSATRQMAGLRTHGLELDRASVELLQELKRLRYVAVSEFQGAELDRKLRERSWEINLVKEGINILSNPLAGAGFTPGENSRAASAIGGALGGAAMGASAGAKFGAPGGHIGAAIGAGIGGLLGAASGLF